MSKHQRHSCILVFDTETTIDASQRLTFGSYRYFHQKERLQLMEEGLFHADDLEEFDRDGFDVLSEYAEARGLRLLARREFLNQVLYPAAYKLRGLVVAFNLPFDLSRLAFAWGESRAPLARGFSLALWEYQDKEGEWHENRFRPRVAIKSIDSKRALKTFTRPLAIDEVDQIPEGSPTASRIPATRSVVTSWICGRSPLH